MPATEHLHSTVREQWRISILTNNAQFLFKSIVCLIAYLEYVE